ncbi:hypothetical protein KIK06_14900 [Nocardiopsis sp. EMB25]|uniref:hypothetical protein n=1 Tax=Nocardiopsis sp. EMB25 TaxID=2835867 RepID=UPI002283D2A3|nr:hypothetical protein [Nocardiopsis sp. EMB25]MCY9785171.1 hypothetical protein [Nocardiopsis sp. EMB25]
MSTSMPYRTPIHITPDHIADLREAAPSACLTWDEDTGNVEAVLPRKAIVPTRMIITSQRGLGELTDLYTAEGRKATDEDLAEDLTDIATDWLTTWPEVRAMNLMCEDLRSHLADWCVYLTQAPTVEPRTRGLPRMTDYYRLADCDRIAEVTMTWAFQEPTRILSHNPTDEARPVADLALDTGGTLTYRAASDLIAGTVWQALDLNG